MRRKRRFRYPRATMDVISGALTALNAVLWHEVVLYTIVGVGLLFTGWSVLGAGRLALGRFSQLVALRHGSQVVRGVYDDDEGPGAITHFQALSAALSATVGLGNIGGVALAIALGGPGAVFWMWMVGLLGMAIKTTEVTLSMLYRRTEDPQNPHGGPMWVARDGLRTLHPSLAGVGTVVGGVFCVTLLVSTATGGNMFQAWNVGDVTQQSFGVPTQVTGIVLAVVVGLVILGGIQRIGAVAGRLVPLMVVLYLLAATYVLVTNAALIPEMLGLIVRSAFNPVEAKGAFLGGTFGYAFLWGMKRALFSNEAGQGSSPIAHSAARTSEPVREAVVAGLEPFIDTIVVCTLTALVILSTGTWNRAADTAFDDPPAVAPGAEAGTWTLEGHALPSRREGWPVGEDRVFTIVEGDVDSRTAGNRHRIFGTVRQTDEGDYRVDWGSVSAAQRPELSDEGVWINYVGAALTSVAFDAVVPGLGTWLVTLSAWLFAISTMISWSYYGEQGWIYLFGEGSVTLYRVVYCGLIVLACSGAITTDVQLDNLTGVGTGVMLFSNIPITLVLAHQAMRAYHRYLDRLDAGDFRPGAAKPVTDVVEGRPRRP